MERILNPRPVLPASRQLFSDRALKAMIVPLLIEQLLQLVVGIADTMMVSYAGEATVSGVSLDTMIYTIFIYLFTAVATGAAGVAWPTTISWVFAAIAMTALCFNEKNDVFVRLGDMLRLKRDMAGRILRIAVPNAAEQVLFQLAKVVLGSLIATFGTSQIAANGIGQTLWSLAACMCTSMSPVFITVVGQCMGAGDTEAAAWYMRKLTRLSLLLSALWNALVLLLVPAILPLYAVTPETRHYIWVIVIIHNIFAGLVQPFAMPLSSGLRAAGDVQFSLWSSLLCTVVFRTALSFMLGLGLNMGIVGIAWAMVLDWCLKALLDVLRFRSGKWKDKRVI